MGWRLPVFSQQLGKRGLTHLPCRKYRHHWEVAELRLQCVEMQRAWNHNFISREFAETASETPQCFSPPARKEAPCPPTSTKRLLLTGDPGKIHANGLPHPRQGSAQPKDNPGSNDLDNSHSDTGVGTSNSAEQGDSPGLHNSPCVLARKYMPATLLRSRGASESSYQANTVFMFL